MRIRQIVRAGAVAAAVVGCAGAVGADAARPVPAPLDPGAVCATPEPPDLAGDLGGLADLMAGAADCSISGSNPTSDYDPTVLYTIQVVVHVIMDSACSQGVVSDELVASQIAVLDEDFQALAGTPGENGTDAAIHFVLASEDPGGSPTTGITRDCNTTWYNDQGNYYDTLAWDPTRYLNLYTNSAAGARGYVPFLPAAGGGQVGQSADRVVVNWLAFGRPGPFPPYDGGRTTTHEVGHYLGLFHPYFGGCGTPTPPDCYTTGDTLCDTPPDAMEHHGCAAAETSCGGVPVPAEIYMELSDDSCMERFTLEQVRRMRCTLETYRPQVYSAGEIFADGFESGDTSAWSATVP